MADVKINPEDTSEQAEVRWGKLAKLKGVGYPTTLRKLFPGSAA